MNTYKVILTLVLLHSFCDTRAQDADTIKYWSSDNRLNWDDFRSSIPITELESNVMAVCPHVIIVSPFRANGILNYHVEVLFLKNQAWTKDTSLYVLSHEQLHFDIAELYARKLRKSINDIIVGSGSSSDLRAVIEELLLKENKAQSDFDKETAHGIYKKLQLEWSEKIAKELELLIEYSSPAGARVPRIP